MTFLKRFGHLLIFAFLTALTQVGGIIWLLSVTASKKLRLKKRYVFAAVYLTFNLFIIPPVASAFGRAALPWFDDNLKPRNWFYPLAFRNYVKPELKAVLFKTSKSENITVTYLDANFPFVDGFPLLPHLSHSDGKKVDLSFMYLDKKGNVTNKKPSVSGYGTYVSSKSLASARCIENGHWQYDFPKYLTFGTLNDLDFDSKKTKALILELLSNQNTEKIFIEPYLKTSLGLQSKSKIRFHGCQAVRHDDHIHLQIK